jgi:hypothetical protein
VDKVFDLGLVEKDIAGKVLGEVEPDVESLGIAAQMAYSTVEEHCQKEVAVEEGTAEQKHLVEVAFVTHLLEGLATLEILKLHGIVDLLHPPMHPMVIHEAIQAICVRHWEEANWEDEDVVSSEEKMAHEGAVSHEDWGKILLVVVGKFGEDIVED